jgi:hypothetical protein
MSNFSSSEREEPPAQQSAVAVPENPGESLRDFIDSLRAIVSANLELIATGRALSCHEDGPVTPQEETLRSMQLSLSRLNVRYELGELTVDEFFKSFGSLLESLTAVTEDEIVESLTDLHVVIDPHEPAIMATSLPPGWPPSVPPVNPPPVELPPKVVEEIRKIINIFKEVLDRGILRGRYREQIAALVRKAEEELARRSLPGLIQTLRELLARGLKPLGKSAAGKAARAALSRIAERLGTILGSRLLLFFGPFFALLFAAQTGYAAGTALSTIKVNDKETIGTWWGNRLWELLRGPCPELLEALNLAIRRWRLLENSGAPVDEVASALARVILLESEYIRRCLAAGSQERTNEEQFKRTLEDRYRQIINEAHRPPGSYHGEKCKATITLKRVIYRGADIGDDWKFSIQCASTMTQVPEHNLAHGATEILDKVIFAQEVGECPCIAVAALTIDAVEVDAFSNDIGSNARLIQIECPSDFEDSIVVRVTEGSNVADLEFVYHVKSICQPIVAP